ncbi:MAG: DUF2680 domain-containing protein [Firmicutes bacterium]|nr:DUF2680 domain-containing protein [Bacillota bacterium]
MKKGLAVLLLAALFMVAFAPTPAVLAAFDDEELAEEILALRRQIHDLRKQVIDKLVAAGKLTAEEGEKYKQKLDERFEWQLKHRFEKFEKKGKGKNKELKSKPRQMQEVPG